MTNVKSAFVDQVIMSGSNFLIVVFAARFLEERDVAVYGYGFTVFMLCFMFANVWIYQNLMTRSSERLSESNDVSNYALLSALLAVFSIPITMLIVLLYVPEEKISIWIVAALLGGFVAVNQLIDFERRVRYFYRRKEKIGPASISIIGFLPRVFALAIIQPASLTTFMLTIVVFSLLGVWIAISRLLRCKLRKDFIPFIKQQFREGKWLAFNIPVNWAWAQAPLFLVGLMLSLNAAGTYVAIKNISNLANIVIEMVPTYFASKLSMFFTNGDTESYRKFLMITALVSLSLWGAGLLFIILFGNDLLLIVLGEGYSGYTFLLILLWCFNLPSFFSRLQFLHLRFIERTYFGFLANIVGLLVLIGSFVLWFYEMKLDGIALAMIFAAIAIVLVQLSVVSFGRAR